MKARTPWIAVLQNWDGSSECYGPFISEKVAQAFLADHTGEGGAETGWWMPLISPDYKKGT